MWNVTNNCHQSYKYLDRYSMGGRTIILLKSLEWLVIIVDVLLCRLRLRLQNEAPGLSWQVYCLSCTMVLTVITLLTVGYERRHHKWQCHLHASQRWHSDTNQWWHCDSSQWRQCHCVISTRPQWCDIAWGRHQQWQTSATDTNIIRLNVNILESLWQCVNIVESPCQCVNILESLCQCVNILELFVNRLESIGKCLLVLLRQLTRSHLGSVNWQCVNICCVMCESTGGSLAICQQIGVT